MPLGKFTVIALADGNFDMPAPKLLHEDKPGIVKSLLGKAGYTDTVPTSINGFLIDTGNKRVLIDRSEEHTSELQSLMRISYAVFCLKKKNKSKHTTKQTTLLYLLNIITEEPTTL